MNRALRDEESSVSWGQMVTGEWLGIHRSPSDPGTVYGAAFESPI